MQIRRVKQQPNSLRSSDAAQLAAVAVAALGCAMDAVPLAGLISLIGLAMAHGALVRRPAPAVPALGAQQVVLGLGVVLATALGVRSP